MSHGLGSLGLSKVQHCPAYFHVILLLLNKRVFLDVSANGSLENEIPLQSYHDRIITTAGGV